MSRWRQGRSRAKAGPSILGLPAVVFRDFNTYLLISTLAVLLCLEGSPAFGTPLLGDFSAAINNAEAVADNPANASFLPTTSFAAMGEVLKSETIAVRYPGLDPITVNNNGISIPTTRPGLVFKPTPKLGLGGFVIPPVPYKFEIEKKKLPVILLNQPFYLNAKIKAELLGVANLAVGYRFNDQFGIGFGGEYIAARFTAVMTEAEKGSPLATVSGTGAIANANIGARIEFAGGRVGLGFAATALQMMKADLQVESPLLQGDDSQATVKSLTSGLNSQTSFGSGLAGIRLHLIPRLTLMGELRYARQDSSQETISLVSLKKQRRDVQDTIAVRSGVILHLNRRINALGGFRFEPSAVGPGSTGTNPLIGYGTSEFLQSVAGLAPLAPYYSLASGLQIGFLPVSQKPNAPTQYWQLTLEGGLTFTEASIGVDATGELPGAYYYRKIGAVGGLRLSL